MNPLALLWMIVGGVAGILLGIAAISYGTDPVLSRRIIIFIVAAAIGSAITTIWRAK